jgi:hypothetical protein
MAKRAHGWSVCKVVDYRRMAKGVNADREWPGHLADFASPPQSRCYGGSRQHDSLAAPPQA